MTTYEVLLKVKELLGPNGERHARGSFARNSEGKPVKPTASTATCWCVVGAVWRESGVRHVGMIPYEVLRLLGKCIPERFMSITEFNDFRNWAQVSAWLDRAIERAKEQQ